VVEVDPTMKALLCAEDLDGDGLITINDWGPKVWGIFLGDLLEWLTARVPSPFVRRFLIQMGTRLLTLRGHTI